MPESNLTASHKAIRDIARVLAVRHRECTGIKPTPELIQMFIRDAEGLLTVSLRRSMAEDFAGEIFMGMTDICWNCSAGDALRSGLCDTCEVACV